MVDWAGLICYHIRVMTHTLPQLIVKHLVVCMIVALLTATTNVILHRTGTLQVP